MTEPVLVERREAIGIVTLNVPARRNALSSSLYRKLGSTLESLQDEAGLRALVIHGGAHFCAGGDLGSLEDSELKARREVQVGQRIVRALIGGRLPAIAAVEGAAFGAGFSIAMACDFAVADPNSSFCAAFGRVGLMPDYGLLWTLPGRVGTALARDIMIFCEPIAGTQAKAMGLVDRLAEPGQVLTTAIAMAERLGALPPASVAAIKSALARHPLSLDALLSWEADTQALLSGTKDFKEGVAAFAERRTARFRGE
jgi:2-(1,2-epoxy-1,2-dihydrophenyl)acetyl-CoA isomerase